MVYRLLALCGKFIDRGRIAIKLREVWEHGLNHFRPCLGGGRIIKINQLFHIKNPPFCSPKVKSFIYASYYIIVFL